MRIKMDGVAEYGESMPVHLCLSDDGRLIVVAENQGGHDCTQVDLLQMLDWLKSSPEVGQTVFEICSPSNNRFPPYDTVVIGESYGLDYYKYVLTDRYHHDDGDWLSSRTGETYSWEWADPPRWWMPMPCQQSSTKE